MQLYNLDSILKMKDLSEFKAYDQIQSFKNDEKFLDLLVFYWFYGKFTDHTYNILN